MMFSIRMVAYWDDLGWTASSNLIQVCGSETQLAPSAKVNVAANWTKQYAVGWALFGAPNSFVLTKLLEDLAL